MTHRMPPVQSRRVSKRVSKRVSRRREADRALKLAAVSRQLAEVAGERDAAVEECGRERALRLRESGEREAREQAHRDEREKV